MANCENLEKCGFFINYKNNSEAISAGWVRMFCEDVEKSERCERKKIFRATGKRPEDNMSPTGKILPV